MRVPLVYLPCCPVPNCLGKQGELSENCLPNLTVRFILSPSNLLIILLNLQNKTKKSAEGACVAYRHSSRRGEGLSGGLARLSWGQSHSVHKLLFELFRDEYIVLGRF